MPGTFGERPGYFYPSITYGDPVTTTVGFLNPATAISVRLSAIRNTQRSLAGLQETQFIRTDYFLTLTCNAKHVDDVNLMINWFGAWGAHGQPSAIVLDRLSTCAGQIEYDRWNTFFDRAICMQADFEPKRLTPGRPDLWTYTYIFLQDNIEL